MIYGERIRQIRKIKRFTQKRLADLTGVKQAAISQFESGMIQPSPLVIEAIANETGFPVAFFERAPGPEVPLGSLAFRSRALRQADVDEAHGWTELAYECAYDLGTRLRVRPASLPNLSGETPDKAARIARSTFGLSPDKPIRNLIHTLEQYGVFILALPLKLDRRDAWATWVGVNPRYPVIILPLGSLGGRLRFTTAHEIYHLLAPDLRGSVALAEDAADQFASEFLLPETGVSDELEVPLSRANISAIGHRWGVSPQFLVRRSVQLRKISESRGQQLYRQLSAEGFARQEPPDAVIRVEKPRLFKRFAEMVYGIPVDARKFASDFALPLPTAQGILNAHAERSELVATVTEGASAKLLRFPSK